MELFLQGAAKGDSTEQGLGEQGLHRQQGKGSQNPQGLGLSLPQILQSQTPRGRLCSRGFWCQHRICPCYPCRDEAAPGLSQPPRSLPAPQVCPSPPGPSAQPQSCSQAAQRSAAIPQGHRQNFNHPSSPILPKTSRHLCQLKLRSQTVIKTWKGPGKNRQRQAGVGRAGNTCREGLGMADPWGTL